MSRIRIQGIKADLLRPHIPDLPSDCEIVAVPSTFWKQRISLTNVPQRIISTGGARTPPEEPKLPKEENVRYFYKRKERLPEKGGSAQSYKAKRFVPQRQTMNVTPVTLAKTTDYLDDELLKKVVNRIVNGELPTIIFGNKGASVYPHPRVYVLEGKGNNYHKASFVIHVRKPKPAAVTEQYQAFEIDEYLREVKIENKPVSTNDDVVTHELDENYGVKIIRYRNVEIDQLPQSMITRLSLLQDAGDLPPYEHPQTKDDGEMNLTTFITVPTLNMNNTLRLPPISSFDPFCSSSSSQKEQSVLWNSIPYQKNANVVTQKVSMANVYLAEAVSTTFFPVQKASVIPQLAKRPLPSSSEQIEASKRARASKDIVQTNFKSIDTLRTKPLMKKFPEESVHDFKHVLYNCLVDNYNEPSTYTFVQQVAVRQGRVTRNGFKFNERDNPEKKLAELYALHLRKAHLEVQDQNSVFIQDLYKFYLRSCTELLSKYFEKTSKWVYLYDDIELFVPDGTLAEAAERMKQMRSRFRRKKKVEEEEDGKNEDSS